MFDDISNNKSDRWNPMNDNPVIPQAQQEMLMLKKRMSMWRLCYFIIIVVATIVLRNYICEHTSDDIDFERVKHDEDYEPTILKRYNKYVVSLNSVEHIKTYVSI
jgi:hypothetical protein